MLFGAGKVDFLKSEQAQVVIIVLFLWKNLGYNMILFMAALASIPKELLEVASLESATKLQVFWHIKVSTPLSLAFIFGILVLSMALSYGKLHK